MEKEKIVSPEEKSGVIDWIMKHSKKIITTISIFIVVFTVTFIGLLLINNMSDDENVIAVVAEEKIYLSDYEESFNLATKGFSKSQIAEAEVYAKEEILDKLIKEKILDKEIASRGLTVNEDYILFAAKQRFSNFEESDSDRKNHIKKLVLIDAKEKVLKDNVTPTREGYMLYCRFDRYSQDDYKDKPEESEAKRVSDKQYAEEYCNGAKNRLENGSSSYDTELASLEADPVIGKKAWEPYYVMFGSQFNKNFFSERTFMPFSDAYEQVLNINPSGNNAHQIITIINKGNFGAEGEERMFGLLFLKDKGSGGETNDFKSWFNDIYEGYNVIKYPERIK